MANQRAAGQTLIAVPLDEALRAAAVEASGSNLSAFVREAIYEALVRRNFKLPRSVVAAPRRAKARDPRKPFTYQEEDVTALRVAEKKPSKKRKKKSP